MEVYQGKVNKTISSIIKGVMIALIATVTFLFVFAAILSYTNVSEKTIEPVIIIITAISILIGSSIGNIKIKKNGLLNGGIIGAAYIIIIYLISSILNWNFGLKLESIIMIFVAIIFGIIGGIIGVNKK